MCPTKVNLNGGTVGLTSTLPVGVNSLTAQYAPVGSFAGATSNVKGDNGHSFFTRHQLGGHAFRVFRNGRRTRHNNCDSRSWKVPVAAFWKLLQLKD